MYKATSLRSPSVRLLIVTACTSRKKFAPLDQLTAADLDEPASRQHGEARLAGYCLACVEMYTGTGHNLAGKIHAFGIGGTATLHLAAILRLDSVDSLGWRNRAARGIIQLPGRGDRLLIQLGNWRGRSLDKKEQALLDECKCPGCQEAGIEGLSISETIGFARRATHNLYVLLAELNEIDNRLKNGSYHAWYSTHVFNGTFLRLIDYALKKMSVK